MTDHLTGVPRSPEHILPSHLAFPVVGIGASAGGLVALRQFFEHLPKQPGMAFVVVLHLSPDHESQAAAVLQRSTAMTVMQVVKATKIEPDHVYVISPTRELVMNDGVLHAEPVQRERGRHVAIDHFLRTLAEAHQDRAMGVVLSGTGGDGTLGLAKIKEQGGVTLAQSPDDAEYEDMPRSAIASGRVDFVLPAADLPAKIAEIWANARRIRLPKPAPDADHILMTPPDEDVSAEKALQDILETLLQRAGHDFRHYKRATVLRRIERRMQVNLARDLATYRDILRKNPDEPRALLDDMLIGVTNFFRDREAFEAVERDVIPKLFAPQMYYDTNEGPRVWVPGCSSGEEAYSLAILMAEHVAEMASPKLYQVFASDIDEGAIATGRGGLYPESILTDVPPARLRQYFTKEQGAYRIAKPIRDRVLFALHNVLRDPPFSRVDLISCRNLLIYLDRTVQTKLLEMFHFALRPGGYLFLGSSESADAASEHFDVVDKRNRIYRSRALARSSRPVVVHSPSPAQPRPIPELARRDEPRGFSFAEVHHRVLEFYAPPSVLVDEESNIVHMSANAGRYLKFPGGEPTTNLVAVVDPALRLELRTTLYQAFHTRESAEAQLPMIDADGRPGHVRIVARPFRDHEADRDLVLVLFEEVSHADATVVAVPHGDRGEVMLRLEQELQRTKDRLQATIEQSETSNEELKASNEELQAINEELRSATEELETSKEELQSVNEELITVNFELKNKVEETAKANDDLQNFIGSTDIATVFVDAGLRIKRYTPRAENIFNILPGDVGRCLLDITHRLAYPDLAADAATAFENLRLIEREVRSLDGRWYVARVLPYRTSDNRIDGAVLTFVDTTMLHAGGDDRAGVDLGRDPAIVVTDDDGRVTGWSSGAIALFGHGEEEMLGRRLEELCTPEDQGHDVPEGGDREFDGHRLGEQVRWYRTRRGDRVLCSSFVARQTGAGDTGHIHVLRMQAGGGNGAPSTVAMRDEFLAVMSHELKNPLNIIALNSEVLARLPELRASPVAVGAVDTLRRAIRGQNQIIDDLLDMSRIRTGKLAITPEPVDLCVVVRELTDVATADPASSGVSIELHAPDCPVVVRADAARLEQIVWNLLSNALKFTPPGGHVRIAVDGEENYVRLDVSDTGRGIAPEFLPRIFDLFGQCSSADQLRGGLGIGLTLVKQLVELHGGRVEARSDGPGHGAVFSVWLPRFTFAMQGNLPKNADPASVRDLRMLLVDDNADAIAAMGTLLEFYGAQVALSTSAEEALALVREQPFDVVVSDLGMPGMDGFALAEAIRALPERAGLALIALSGYGRPEDIRRTGDAGFDVHLGKPLSVDALDEAIAGLRKQGRL